MSRIDRREFLKLVGAGGVGTGAGFMLAESIKHPVEHLVPYPVPPEEFSPGIATWYNSVCGMCSAGCGIRVRTREGRAKKIEGNPLHPVNQGRLCALGQAGLQALYNPDRVTGPQMLDGDRGSARYKPITWEDGLAAVSRRLGDAGNATGRVVFLSHGLRGHLADLLDTFVTGLGGAELLYYDFADPQTLYAANRRFFGIERLPYYDIANARYVISFGADFLTSWLSPVHNSLGFGNSRQGRDDGRGRFVQVEPKMSLSGAAADLWVPAAPGSEGLLALAMAARIVSQGGYDGGDRADWETVLGAHTPERAAEASGVDADTVRRLADEFAASDAALAIGGGAAANQGNGVDTLVAVNALNYLAGNIGRPGGVVFNPDPVAGRTAITHRASYRDLRDVAERARQDSIDVLIVNDTNPVFTLPRDAGFAEALANIPMIVSLSPFLDETAVHADYLLPSHTYLESWADDMPEPGVGFSVASIRQPVVAPLYDTRATGDIVLALGRHLGLEQALPWSGMEAFLKDRWREVTAASDDDTAFDETWRQMLQAGVRGENVRGDAAFVLDPETIDAVTVADAQFAGDPNDYPFVLHPYLSTALHDGRGANLPWMQELPDPITSVVYGSWVEINPATAAELGIETGDLVDVRSEQGSLQAPAFLFPGIMPGVLAMPIGQGHSQFGRYARDRGANPLALLAPVTDEPAGSLAWGATRVGIAATGRKAELVMTSGTPRELGRGIIQSTGGESGSSGHSATLRSIPITVERA